MDAFPNVGRGPAYGLRLSTSLLVALLIVGACQGATTATPGTGLPSPTASTSSTASAGSPSVRPEVEASPTEPAASPSAATAPDLKPSLWAKVIADAVNVRASAGLASPIRGTVRRGQFVYVLETAPVTVNALTWYEIQATPLLRGWAAVADASETLLSPDGASGRAEWCAAPTDSAYALAEETPKAGLVLGQVPTQSDLFSLAALNAHDLAWVDGAKTVCPTFELSNGSVMSATFRADFATCLHPWEGAVGWYVSRGDASVGPNGEPGSRSTKVREALFGYAQSSPPRQNPDQLLILAHARGNNYQPSSQTICIDVQVGGGKSNTTVNASFSADVCASVVSIDASAVVLRGIAPWDGRSDLEFFRYPGSTIDTGIVAGSTIGIGIVADDGVAGAVHMRPTAVAGCG